MEASETLEGQPVYQDSKHEFHAPSARAVRPLLPVTIRVATGESPHYCFPSAGARPGTPQGGLHGAHMLIQTNLLHRCRQCCAVSVNAKVCEMPRPRGSGHQMSQLFPTGTHFNLETKTQTFKAFEDILCCGSYGFLLLCKRFGKTREVVGFFLLILLCPTSLRLLAWMGAGTAVVKSP